MWVFGRGPARDQGRWWGGLEMHQCWRAGTRASRGPGICPCMVLRTTHRSPESSCPSESGIMSWERRTSQCVMRLLLLALPTSWKRKAYSTANLPYSIESWRVLSCLYTVELWKCRVHRVPPFALRIAGVLLVCLTNEGRKDVRALLSVQRWRSGL